ncbi:MAG: L,D-transpeptidase [Oryzomonas sp.]|uniref:L,D-transpeptidase n=1 Tax=Oryzomonas sp. TaxID=2855186 RepID=UPI00283B74C1|nr:L,D-transpeptidase [Oryzomonas sp.]MDR3579866.1 L,D-transpeptidase [Oryzomonas sp.]
MKYLAQTMLSLVVVLLCFSRGLASAKLKSLCEVNFPSDTTIEWNCVKLTWEDSPEKLFGAYWQDVLRFNRMDRRHFYGGISIKVPARLEDIKGFTPLPTYYPEAAAEKNFILVDQSEMFLGAYEHGRLVLSFPAAVGIEGHRVPNGEFRVDAVDRRHTSNMYRVEEIGRLYPMHYGLRFFRDKSLPTTPSYYIHGRDVPGYPASHGCIGLYDEEMQIEYYRDYDRKVYGKDYHELKQPLLQGAQSLYQWVVGHHDDNGKFHKISYGPRVLIVGTPPL